MGQLITPISKSARESRKFWDTHDCMKAQSSAVQMTGGSAGMTFLVRRHDLHTKQGRRLHAATATNPMPIDKSPSGEAVQTQALY